MKNFEYIYDDKYQYGAAVYWNGKLYDKLWEMRILLEIEIGRQKLASM